MSSGFDLLNLFESKRKSSSLFTSKCSASSIMSKLEFLAKKLNFRIIFSKDYKVKMQSTFEGRKGKLLVGTEITLRGRCETCPQRHCLDMARSLTFTFNYLRHCIF